MGEPQSVLVCILLKNVNATGGEGMPRPPAFRTQVAQKCPWLSAGEGAAELPSAEIDETRGARGRAGVAPGAAAYRTHRVCLAAAHRIFSQTTSSYLITCL